MRDDPLRRRQAGRHQERRPVQRVLADDLLADQVRHGRPEALDARGCRRIVGAEAERGQVVRQRVEPDVHHVLRDRRAPGCPTGTTSG